MDGIKTFFTQGPYSIRFEPNSLSMNTIGTYSIQGPKGVIAVCEESSIEETRGNAQLLAASPELLEVLERVFNECVLQGCSHELNAFIVSTIKKAKGE